MNTIGQQMALARGAAAAGQRVALAEACDVAEACDGARPWSAWLSAVGGLGSVLGDGNASTFTYNAGGAAAGLDYRFDPRFLVGLSVGYTHGTQWTNGFMGQGFSDTVSFAAYGSFTQGRSTSMRWRASPGPTTSSSARSSSPACSPHRQRQHRRQPVPRPGRGRLQDRHLRAGAGQPDAVRPPGGAERHAERLLRIGRQLAQPQRRAAGHQLAALDPRRGAGGRAAARRREQARAGAAARLAARVRRHQAGRSAPPSPARRAIASPSTAPRRCATAP